jgi:hypothetical protein
MALFRMLGATLSDMILLVLGVAIVGLVSVVVATTAVLSVLDLGTSRATNEARCSIRTRRAMDHQVRQPRRRE